MDPDLGPHCLSMRHQIVYSLVDEKNIRFVIMRFKD